MKQVRFIGQNDWDGDITIPSGSQLTHIRVVPGIIPDSSPARRQTWIRINESKPFYLTQPLVLGSDTFGFCCETDNQLDQFKRECDRYPGDVQIVITIGPSAAPENIDEDELGVNADEVLIAYIGGP